MKYVILDEREDGYHIFLFDDSTQVYKRTIRVIPDLAHATKFATLVAKHEWCDLKVYTKEKSYSKEYGCPATREPSEMTRGIHRQIYGEDYEET